jgi:hypothetical protein
MKNIFMIGLRLFQAQGASASALSSGHVLLHISYYDKGFNSLIRKRNGGQMSRQMWKENPSDPSGSKNALPIKSEESFTFCEFYHFKYSDTISEKMSSMVTAPIEQSIGATRGVLLRRGGNHVFAKDLPT